jgi:hypothetical protein
MGAFLTRRRNVNLWRAREAVSLYFNICTDLLCLRLPGATPYDERVGLLSPAMLTNAATVATIGTRRITQLQYLLQLSSPTSEKAVNAKFAEFSFHALR